MQDSHLVLWSFTGSLFCRPNEKWGPPCQPGTKACNLGRGWGCTPASRAFAAGAAKPPVEGQCHAQNFKQFLLPDLTRCLFFKTKQLAD